MNIIILDICKKGNNCNPYNNCGGMYLIKNYQSKSIKMDFISLFPEIPIGANKEYTRNNLLKKINNFRNIKYIIIACHTASSCILDILINNNHLINNIKIFEPIIPMCIYIKHQKYQNILILSTSLTARIRWHARILKSNVRYLTFDLLPSEIENNNINNIHNTLIRLSSVKHFLSICDCVVLGCTHFNVIKNTISKYLKQNNFTGKILDSNSILYKYLKKKKKKKII